MLTPQSIAKAAHKDQKYGVHPYIYHVQNVVDKVNKLYWNNRDRALLRDIAYLHDVIEDTAYTPAQLSFELSGYSRLDELLNALVAISKQDGEAREIYLARCCADPLAWQVKVADTLCNLEESVLVYDSKKVSKYTDQLGRLYDMKPHF